MILGRKWVPLGGVVAAFLVLGACSGSRDGGTASRSKPTTAGSAPGAGTGAASLPARWWSWVEASPPADNPVNDATGAQCAAHQPSDVWFLAGTYGGSASRVCTIPAGRPIYLPVINLICTVPHAETATQALTSCTEVVDSTTASLDGKALRPTEATSQTTFTFTARPNSSTGFTPGGHQAVAWGLWIGPLSLTVGRHTLTFAAVSGDFAVDVTYQLNVTALGGTA